jgi:hypothetical protein
VFGQSGDFLIWSSSRSPTASNSHALPYIVVEVELLASDQSGAFFFRLIVKLNLELCSCARPIAHHAPITTTFTDDGITAATAGPIRCPLLSSCYRRVDPTSRRSYVANFEPHLRPFQNNQPNTRLHFRLSTTTRLSATNYLLIDAGGSTDQRQIEKAPDCNRTPPKFV